MGYRSPAGTGRASLRLCVSLNGMTNKSVASTTSRCAPLRATLLRSQTAGSASHRRSMGVESLDRTLKPGQGRRVRLNPGCVCIATPLATKDRRSPHRRPTEAKLTSPTQSNRCHGAGERAGRRIRTGRRERSSTCPLVFIKTAIGEALHVLRCPGSLKQPFGVQSDGL